MYIYIIYIYIYIYVYIYIYARSIFRPFMQCPAGHGTQSTESVVL